MRHGNCCPKFCKEHYQSRGKSLGDRFIAWGGDIIIIIIIIIIMTSGYVRPERVSKWPNSIYDMIYDDDDDDDDDNFLTEDGCQDPQLTRQENF